MSWLQRWFSTGGPLGEWNGCSERAYVKPHTLCKHQTFTAMKRCREKKRGPFSHVVYLEGAPKK
jgi:hypothetical protein